jgi:alginate O-acetyltransferase complex protein AlgI
MIFAAPAWPWLKTRLARLTQGAPVPFQSPLQTAGHLTETVLLVVLLLVSSAWLAGGTYNPFIYYRF